MSENDESEDKTIFRTLNSAYTLDRGTGYWYRMISHGDQDPVMPLRTEDGPLWAHGPIKVGKPLVMIGPPHERGQARMITTSTVVEILSGSTDAWTDGQWG